MKPWSTMTTKEREAWNLLVEAAPDLLDVVESFYALHTGEYGPDDFDEAQARTIRKAEVCISKVRGEEQTKETT